MIDQKLCDFIAGDVMIVVAGVDNDRRPCIARAVGAVPHPGEGQVDLLVSTWQWPTVVENARGGRRLAATFSQPSDYVTYQLKGPAKTLVPSEAHAEAAKRYIARMTSLLSSVGLEFMITMPRLVDRSLVVLRLTVESAFVQTPGPNAGKRLEPGE